MDKKCAKCGRQMAEGRREWVCDECKTIEVRLELTQCELHVVTTALKEEAANLRHAGDDWKFEAEALTKVAEAFRTAPGDMRRRMAEDAHIQWRYAQE